MMVDHMHMHGGSKREIKEHDVSRSFGCSLPPSPLIYIYIYIYRRQGPPPHYNKLFLLCIVIMFCHVLHNGR